ncbi:YqeB family protein [Streptomyces umbrinus]|uniref:YqeB family protein n=1 Tax=Streptomyces umbrinus TaxID=67370 RepID=UPI003C2EA1DF
MEKSGPDPRDGTVAGSGEATVLAEPVWQLMLVCVGCGGVGGWLLTLLADLWLSLPWVPMKGPARLLTSVPEPWLTVGAVVVGLALGVLVGFIAVYESLTARISDSGVVLTIRDSDQEFARDEIALACRDGKQLVLVAPDGGELARERCGLPWRRLAETFAAHGYDWGAPRGA